MTPEERKMLEETLVLTKENNKMLVKLRRNQWWGSVLKAIYWGLIIALSLGAYYFIQPVLGQLGQTYSAVGEDVKNISNITNSIKSNFGN